MKCPVCNDIRMREVIKDNVLIDICPECKGVWLDRGELEKLIDGEREQYRAPEEYRDNGDRERDRGQRDYEQRGNYGKPYKKKKTMLDVFGDLFD